MFSILTAFVRAMVVALILIMADPTSDSDSQLKTLLHALQLNVVLLSAVEDVAHSIPRLYAPKKKKKNPFYRTACSCSSSPSPALCLGAFLHSPQMHLMVH